VKVYRIRMILRQKRTRTILLGTAGPLLLSCFAATAQAQDTSDSQACPGSTVDSQGADVARRARALLAELQTAVNEGDKTKGASTISYPLMVIHGSRKASIKTKAEFLSKYDTIFDQNIRRAIAQQSAKCLFGNYQGNMIGNGEVWFSEQQHGAMKIITVNPTAGAQ
jgi:hypothetical protein